MASPRRRRGQQSPTSMIVNFFLDADLSVAQAALELAQTLIARRSMPKRLSIDEPRTTTTSVNKPAPAPTPLPTPLAAEAAPAAIPPPATPRQRAKRSDAGQPRKRSVAASAASADASTPTRRRGRPPVTIVPATPAPIETFPPELPPQDVPYEARDVD